jgi:hypothetical protein
MDRDRAVAQDIAPVSTPTLTTPSSQAKDVIDPPTRTTPITTPAPSEHSMRSDKLPDPYVFTGDRKDLRRFLSQVSQKLRVSANRYPTPAACLAYVSPRLSGPAYPQSDAGPLLWTFAVNSGLHPNDNPNARRAHCGPTRNPT